MKKLVSLQFFLVSLFACVQVHSREIVILAPNGLKGAIAEVAARFERVVNGTKVRCIFTNAETILQRMLEAAPVDILITANMGAMDAAAARKLLLNDTRRVIMRDRLVLIAPAASSLRMTSLADLLRGDVRRISVGLPDSVASGNFARQALEASGLWHALYGKFVFSPTASQSLDRVVREEVELAFAFQSDVNALQAKVRKVLDIYLRIPILYPVAVASGSSNKGLARRFVDFVGSPEASEIFEQFGFLRP